MKVIALEEVEEGDLEQESLPVRFPIIHYNYFPLYIMSMSCNYTHNSIVW